MQGFDFTESVVIDAPHPTVWQLLCDIDRWWLASNPEHRSLEHLDDRPATEVGAEIRVRESIGGLPGEAVGTITAVEPGSAVTWRARAKYRWLGVTVPVEEGVTWRAEPAGESRTTVSARVWATFPRGPVGRLVTFAFLHLLDGEEKDREHARTELRYLKRTVEG